MSYPADEPGLLAPQWVASYALGPAQIGYTMQIWLLGVFTTAFGAYSLSGELARHRALGRIALWLVFALNWAFTGLCVYESYVSAVSQSRTVVALASGDIAWQFLPALSGLIGVVTQAFLTSHAMVLIPNMRLRYVFCCCMGILIAAQTIGFVAACIKGIYYVVGREADDALTYNRSLALWLWTSAAADISISLVCSYSIRERLHGYTNETDTIIVKLVVICFRTAAYTSLMSLVGAIVATAFRDDFDLRSFTGFVFWLCTPALYGLALFTFSRSSRRIVDRRPAVSEATETQPVIRVERKGYRFRANPSWRSHRVEQSHGGSAASAREGGGGGGGIGRPLAIRVDRERVISIDEPRDDLEEHRSMSCGASASSAGHEYGLKPPMLPRKAMLSEVQRGGCRYM